MRSSVEKSNSLSSCDHFSETLHFIQIQMKFHISNNTLYIEVRVPKIQ